VLDIYPDSSITDPGNTSHRGRKAESARGSASDGKPDLSGIWQAEPAPLNELLRFIPAWMEPKRRESPPHRGTS
jgi:hypothetical protein